MVQGKKIKYECASSKYSSRRDCFKCDKKINDADGMDSVIVVDFTILNFVFPIGALILAQYLKYNRESKGREIKFVSTNIHTNAIGYLTSVGFFKYFGENPFNTNDLRKGNL